MQVHQGHPGATRDLWEADHSRGPVHTELGISQATPWGPTSQGWPLCGGHHSSMHRGSEPARLFQGDEPHLSSSTSQLQGEATRQPRSGDKTPESWFLVFCSVLVCGRLVAPTADRMPSCHGTTDWLASPSGARMWARSAGEGPKNQMKSSVGGQSHVANTRERLTGDLEIGLNVSTLEQNDWRQGNAVDTRFPLQLPLVLPAPTDLPNRKAGFGLGKDDGSGGSPLLLRLLGRLRLA
ncbi:hypothetical protein QBC47DRAFT_456421, partial [Echria macrotheca]